MIFIYELDKEIARVKLDRGKFVITKSASPGIKSLIETLRQFAGATLSDQELYASLPFRLKGRIWAGYKNGSKEALEFEARLKAGKAWPDLPTREA